jgi:hypothetical protein
MLRLFKIAKGGNHEGHHVNNRDLEFMISIAIIALQTGIARVILDLRAVFRHSS